MISKFKKKNADLSYVDPENYWGFQRDVYFF